jgi:hypothetical protein
MINFSDDRTLDLCWAKDFMLRRFTVTTVSSWALMIYFNSYQSWCIPSKLYLYVGRVRICLYFLETSMTPEIVFMFSPFSQKKFELSVYCRRWLNNLRYFFNRSFAF